MHSLILLATRALVEQACDALMFELDAQSVSVDDADAESESEQALFGEPGMPVVDAGWTRSRMVALFQSEAQARTAADTLLAEPWAATLGFVAIQSVPDADWVRLTQSQFEPVAVTDSFWIVPSWHAAPAAASKVLRLDPGLAFGSGTHATTRMCLRWIADHVFILNSQFSILNSPSRISRKTNLSISARGRIGVWRRRKHRSRGRLV